VNSGEYRSSRSRYFSYLSSSASTIGNFTPLVVGESRLVSVLYSGLMTLNTPLTTSDTRIATSYYL